MIKIIKINCKKMEEQTDNILQAIKLSHKLEEMSRRPIYICEPSPGHFVKIISRNDSCSKNCDENESLKPKNQEIIYKKFRYYANGRRISKKRAFEINPNVVIDNELKLYDVILEIENNGKIIKKRIKSTEFLQSENAKKYKFLDKMKSYIELSICDPKIARMKYYDLPFNEDDEFQFYIDLSRHTKN